MTVHLHDLLDASASRFPDRIAVEECESGSVRYSELAQLSDRVRDRLRAMGVNPGDRVGLCMRKSADTVAALFGIMKAGAAYVPVDPTAPAPRSAFIFQDCEVKAVIAEERFAEALRKEFEQAGFVPGFIVTDGVGGGLPLGEALVSVGFSPSTPSVKSSSSDLAYILYTSGSTGNPKGVMLTHDNAVSFVEWCSEVLQPNEEDRFSSHAPFHFDLSILDIYVSLKHGATLVIVEEGMGKDPKRLGPWISEKKLTVWYSAPSALSLMVQFGKLEEHDYSSLRLVLFAGEVFPIKHLRTLKLLWPQPRYLNLYGPTETNVCTFFEAPEAIPDSQTEPLPIGPACSHCEALVVDEDGTDVEQGAEGELCIAGPSVLQGYWNLPENTAKAFLPRVDNRWYRTGDIVVETPDSGFIFLGRRDRMIKKRGYRIELGEIEAALYRHPEIKEAAVVAFTDHEDVPVKAFLAAVDNAMLSTIALKSFCSKHLPLYMIPDTFTCLEKIPKTSTGKTDYQALAQLA